MKFKVEESRRVGSVQVLTLSGRLVMGDGAEVLDASLQEFVARGDCSLLVDCSGVTAIDSQGICSLVRNAVSLHKCGGQLKLLKLSPRVRLVLEVTRLLTVIEAFDDEQAALHSF